MAENKTKPTTESVAAYLAKIANDGRRKDCKALVSLMKTATGQQPKLWGSIVGFGRYHYTYDSGHEGDTCLVGFSSRKTDISIYLFPVFSQKETLLKKLGKHKMGKGCLYVRKLDDVDTGVLLKMVVASIAEIRRRYPE